MNGAEWTIGEINRLRKAYPVKSKAELAAAFPRHPLSSIVQTARKNGFRRRKPVSRYLKYAAEKHVPTFDFGSVAVRMQQAAE